MYSPAADTRAADWVVAGIRRFAESVLSLVPAGFSAWPDDRAWCVATEIDLVSAYVGGAASCLDEVAARRAVEALRAPAELGIAWDSDLVSPRPELR